MGNVWAPRGSDDLEAAIDLGHDATNVAEHARDLLLRVIDTNQGGREFERQEDWRGWLYLIDVGTERVGRTTCVELEQLDNASSSVFGDVGVNPTLVAFGCLAT